MGDVQSSASDRIDGYVSLCGFYDETVRRSRDGRPHSDGKHADRLRARLRTEEKRRRDTEHYKVLCRLLGEGIEYAAHAGKLVPDCYGSHAKSLLRCVKRARTFLAKGTKKRVIKRRLRPQAIHNR